MSEKSLDLKKLRVELWQICDAGRKGLLHINQADMLIHFEAAFAATSHRDLDMLKYHLLQVSKECLPWLVEQNCPIVVEMMKELHLDRINVDRQSGNDRPE